MERQAGVKVKILQCDGASEFIDKNLSQYILSQERNRNPHFSPCCPQENGVAERGNYIQWSTAQVIHLAAELPANFWKFVERMAAKLISMTVKEGEKITPLENCMRENPQWI